MPSYFSKLSLFCCLGAAGFLLLFFINVGRALSVNLDEACQWGNIEQGEKTLSRDDFRTLLEQCKKYYEDKSDNLKKDIAETAQEKQTLSNTISLLRKKINNLDYQINQSNVMIKDLHSQIQDTQASIEQTNDKIEQIKQKLGNLLQLRYEQDQRSTIEILLGEETISDFVDELVALDMLHLEIQELLKHIKGLKSGLETQKDTMDSEKKELEHLVIIQSLQKQESSQQKVEHEYLLDLTEKEYQSYLQEKKDAEEKVTKIGNLLFELLEVPEGGIKFEDAVAIAKEVGKQTGIRPAFSLAILWQETRIGKLKGGCYLRDTTTGDGVYIKTGNKAPRTMKPSRDIPYFLTIIDELNKAGKLNTDYAYTPVSCCMITENGYFGWGGAMGPSQFIPSTWMLYKESIEKKTGAVPANPWNVRDAFLANALYLKDLGAGVQTYEKEINAALRYFGCTSSWCQQNYGIPVMRVSQCFQEYIDKGYMSVSCKESVF